MIKKRGRDLSFYIEKTNNKFHVDRYDVMTGEELVTPGEVIRFKFKRIQYNAIVTEQTMGRDDDTYLLQIL